MATKKMTNAELAAWIYGKNASVTLLQQAYAFYALPAPMPTVMADLQKAIYAHLITLTKSDVADWQPPAAPSPATSSSSTSSRRPSGSSSSARTSAPAPVVAPLAFTPHNTLGHFREDEPQFVQFNGTGGDNTRYAWSIKPLIGGTPLSWVSMDRNTGELSVNPDLGSSSNSPYRFIVRLEDGKNSVEKDVIMYVDNPASPAVVTTPGRSRTVVTPAASSVIVHEHSWGGWPFVIGAIALLAIVGLVLAFLAWNGAQHAVPAVVSQSQSITLAGCTTCGSAPIIVSAGNGNVTQDPAIVVKNAKVAACGCTTGESAPTISTPLNADDNLAIDLTEGVYDVEDTSGEPQIRQDGTGVHNFYLIYVRPGETKHIAAYKDSRIRVWKFQGQPSANGAMCEVYREMIDFAQKHVGTDTTVMFFGNTVLDHGTLKTVSNESAATFSTPLNADDNLAIDLTEGVYDVEDTSLESQIRQDGTGVHNFYLIYVRPGETMHIAAYKDSRIRVWKFQGQPSANGAMCEVYREASDFAQKHVGTDTTVLFFGIPMLDKGVAK